VKYVDDWGFRSSAVAAIDRRARPLARSRLTPGYSNIPHLSPTFASAAIKEFHEDREICARPPVGGGKLRSSTRLALRCREV